MYLQDCSLVSMHWKSPKISRQWKESRLFYVPQSKDYIANLNVWKGETTLTSQTDIQRALQMRKTWLLWPSSQKVSLSCSFGTVQRILHKELYLWKLAAKWVPNKLTDEHNYMTYSAILMPNLQAQVSKREELWALIVFKRFFFLQNQNLHQSLLPQCVLSYLYTNTTFVLSS